MPEHYLTVLSSYPITPTYFITGIWKSSDGLITHVLLHTNEGHAFATGVKVSTGHAASLIEANNSIMTLRWNYTSAAWESDGFIHVVEEHGIKYLRSIKGGPEEGNIENMILMNGLIAGV